MKVPRALTHHSRRSNGFVPSFSPTTGTKASSSSPARANRIAAAVNGGMLPSPMRIAAQVVPQTTVMTTRAPTMRQIGAGEADMNPALFQAGRKSASLGGCARGDAARRLNGPTQAALDDVLALNTPTRAASNHALTLKGPTRTAPDHAQTLKGPIRATSIDPLTLRASVGATPIGLLTLTGPLAGGRIGPLALTSLSRGAQVGPLALTGVSRGAQVGPLTLRGPLGGGRIGPLAPNAPFGGASIALLASIATLEAQRLPNRAGLRLSLDRHIGSETLRTNRQISVETLASHRSGMQEDHIGSRQANSIHELHQASPSEEISVSIPLLRVHGFELQGQDARSPS